ncbi:hypothetical protein C922_02869 [Plasmodium inui San Antonio 1]|uniref:RRM domain-containing protein n=1 Tax=Plasmodium inui San Antonio 1 TaxID=1237626 RepID=W7A6M4_9APIC|nr:hypothetical protein C922_02869 [Plasmodium inui San Antonio 1]EUD66883.1 hypothetical protein C922_02869 [Plasmodium inui San Antonio 1]
MEKLSRLFPTERSLVKIKNIAPFEGELEIQNFLGHMVDVCLMRVDRAKNEAYALVHSNEEASHLLRLYKAILKNMIFLCSSGRGVETEIDIEIFDKDEERTFWRDAKRNNLYFNIWWEKRRGHISV